MDIPVKSVPWLVVLSVYVAVLAAIAGCIYCFDRLRFRFRSPAEVEPPQDADYFACSRCHSGEDLREWPGREAMRTGFERKSRRIQIGRSLSPRPKSSEQTSVPLSTSETAELKGVAK